MYKRCYFSSSFCIDLVHLSNLKFKDVFFPFPFFPPLPLSYICSFPEGRWQFIQEYMLHVPFPKVFIYSCSFEYGSRCYKKCGFPEGSIGGRVVPTKIKFWGPGICWVLGVLNLYLDRFHHWFRAYIPTNEGDFTMLMINFSTLTAPP